MTAAGADAPAAADLMQWVTSAFPELTGLPCHILGSGFDSVALDVDDRLVFKFPRHEMARAALVREAAMLAIVRPAVALPVPNLVICERPQLFSRHDKIKGEHLLAADYAALPVAARDRLADDLARFFAALHALDPARMTAAGARPIKPWLEPRAILAGIEGRISSDLEAYAKRGIAAFEALPPDPLGETYGFFDGHGWNMALDHGRGRLNGVYDFADSGFGGLHQEFIYPAFVSPDLTARVIAAYETLTLRSIDRRRVHLLATMLRLSELAEFAASGEADAAVAAETLARWAALPEPE